MSGTPDTRAHARGVARRDRVYAAHLFLCLCMLAWRAFEATPGWSAAQNGTFAASPVGVALIMVSVWSGVASAVGAAAWTAATRTDAKLWVLLILMLLSMIWRRDIDVFDITYVALAAILSACWFNAGRARMQSTLAEAPRRAAGF